MTIYRTVIGLQKPTHPNKYDLGIKIMSEQASPQAPKTHPQQRAEAKRNFFIKDQALKFPKHLDRIRKETSLEKFIADLDNLESTFKIIDDAITPKSPTSSSQKLTFQEKFSQFLQYLFYYIASHKHMKTDKISEETIESLLLLVERFKKTLFYTNGRNPCIWLHPKLNTTAIHAAVRLRSAPLAKRLIELVSHATKENPAALLPLLTLVETTGSSLLNHASAFSEELVGYLLDKTFALYDTATPEGLKNCQKYMCYKNTDGSSVKIAAGNNQLGVLELLVNRYLSLFKIDTPEKLTDFYNFLSDADSRNHSPLGVACTKGYEVIMDFLLETVSKYFDVDSLVNYVTQPSLLGSPLKLASTGKCRPRLVERILQAIEKACGSNTSKFIEIVQSLYEEIDTPPSLHWQIVAVYTRYGAKTSCKPDKKFSLTPDFDQGADSLPHGSRAAFTQQKLEEGLTRDLHKAIEAGSSFTVQKLLKAKANPNWNTDEIPPALIQAARHKLNVITPIMHAKADMGNSENPVGHVALHCAIKQQDMHTALDLIHWKAEVNGKDEQGFSPLRKAVYTNQYTIVRHLLQAQASIHETDTAHESLLHFAIDNDAHDSIEHLVRAKADVHSTDKNGLTPLIKIVSKGNFYLSHLLIVANAEVSKTTPQGKTALQIALDKNLQLLPLILVNLNKYADYRRYYMTLAHCLFQTHHFHKLIPKLISSSKDLREPSETSAAESSLSSSASSSSTSASLPPRHLPLYQMASLGSPSAHFRSAGKPPSKSEKQKTMVKPEDKPKIESQLIVAMKNMGMRNTSLVKDLLMEHPWAIDTRDEEGNSLVMMAAKSGIEATKLILAHIDSPADRQHHINRPNHTGMTALMLASQHGQDDTVALLLQQGADRNMMLASGLTALTLSSDPKVRQVFELDSRRLQTQSAVRKFAPSTTRPSVAAPTARPSSSLSLT